MEDEQPKELFTQDGVILYNAPAAYTNFYKNSGTLMITEYNNEKRCIEWKSNEVTIESDVQDQEWAVVSAVQAPERRSRTLSGGTTDNSISRNIKINMATVKSFKVSKKFDRLSLHGGDGESIISFLFQHGNCSGLVGTLNRIFKTTPSKRDKTLYVLMNDNEESQKLSTSFMELDIFQDEPTHIWKFIRNFQSRPYCTTMETLSKLSDFSK